MVLLGTVAGAASFGDAAAIVTLILRLYQAGHRAWAITALLFAILGPSVLLAPFAARILARGGRWRSLVLVCAGQAAAAIGLIFATGTAPTLLLVVVLGAGLALTQPALMEITPAVVGPDRLVWANSVTKSADWTGWTVGPLAGGALCAVGWASAALGIEAASFVIAGACFAALSRVRAGTRTASRSLGPPSPAAGGPREARYLRRDRELAAAHCGSRGCQRRRVDDRGGRGLLRPRGAWRGEHRVRLAQLGLVRGHGHRNAAGA